MRIALVVMAGTFGATVAAAAAGNRDIADISLAGRVSFLQCDAVNALSCQRGWCSRFPAMMAVDVDVRSKQLRHAWPRTHSPARWFDLGTATLQGADKEHLEWRFTLADAASTLKLEVRSYALERFDFTATRYSNDVIFIEQGSCRVPR